MISKINKNDVLDILKAVVNDKRVKSATREFMDDGWKFAAVGFGVGVVATSAVCAIKNAKTKKDKKKMEKKLVDTLAKIEAKERYEQMSFL